ncbi:MAG: hypothetical protein ACJ77A_03110 [Actinomycetota bacterium]
MAGTITRTPEELLALAIDEVEAAEAILEERRKEQATARKRADSTTGLNGAAQRQWRNAEARFRVLAEGVELSDADAKALQAKYDETREAHDAVTRELAQAEATHDSIKRARDALASVVKAARQWNASAKRATTVVATSAKHTDSAATAAPAGAQKTALANSAGTLREQQEALDAHLVELAEWQKGLRDAEAELKAAAPDPAKLRGLRAREERLDRQLAAAHDALQAKAPGASPAEIQEARKEFEAAERALVEAPEAERRAHAELRLAEEALAEAEEHHKATLEVLSEAEQKFVERIDVSEPDSAGLVLAEARLPRPIPAGYELQWTVEAGGLLEDVGSRVRIDARAVPTGTYVVEAHLRRK